MRISLNQNWRLLYRPVNANDVAEIEAATDFMDAGNLPCDVRMPLINHGIIKDPVVADYCFDSEWVEDKSWWFTNTFTLSEDDTNAHGICIVLEHLDLYANIYINGQHIGIHNSCHYPFQAEISAFVKVGENKLTICLTAGLEKIPKEQEEGLIPFVCTEKRDGRHDNRGEARRVYLRKPQYVYGWDWAPRIATIGIMKNAFVQTNRDFAITHVHAITTDMHENRASVSFRVEFESFYTLATKDVKVWVNLMYEGTPVTVLCKEVLAQPGTNFVNLCTVLDNPKIWWPNGMGEQPLYTIQTDITMDGETYKGQPLTMGIRTIDLNIDAIDQNRRNFKIRLNGFDIFCKGANWIPADSIYARVSPGKYETLIKEAKEANFNMLRVWGGGLYEPDLFYELCNKYGILVWQDFMFACAMYPTDDDFLRRVEKEVDYQTKRLRSHPCIAMWCGNNEIQYIFEKEVLTDTLNFGNMDIYHKIIPQIVRNNCGEMPYWRSSPFGGSDPNSNEVGTRHHWSDCTMNADMEKRITPEEYDKVESAFMSEYGYIGPCSQETIKKYYGGQEIKRNDAIWNLHNNTFEKETVAAGIKKHYANPDELSLDEYLKYARLVQGLMYSYSLESIRFYEHSGGSLFWMYNDTWGEVGWSIIDYYLDRKPSYYYVKRAFAPIRLILRPSECGKKVLMLGVNDTTETVKLNVEYGYVSFKGKYFKNEILVTLLPLSKNIVSSFDMPRYDLSHGVVYSRARGVPMAILRTVDYKDYKERRCAVKLLKIDVEGNDYNITIKSSGYCHAVRFEPYMKLSDEYFDLLPGEIRTVTAYGAVGSVDKNEIKVL